MLLLLIFHVSFSFGFIIFHILRPYIIMTHLAIFKAPSIWTPNFPFNQFSLLWCHLDIDCGKQGGVDRIFMLSAVECPECHHLNQNDPSHWPKHYVPMAHHWPWPCLWLTFIPSISCLPHSVVRPFRVVSIIIIISANWRQRNIFTERHLVCSLKVSKIQEKHYMKLTLEPVRK